MIDNSSVLIGLIVKNQLMILWSRYFFPCLWRPADHIEIEETVESVV